VKCSLVPSIVVVSSVDVDTHPPIRARVIATERTARPIRRRFRHFPNNIQVSCAYNNWQLRLHSIMNVTIDSDAHDSDARSGHFRNMHSRGDGFMCRYVSRSCHAAGSVARVTGWHGPGHEDYSNQSWKRHSPEPSGEPRETVDSVAPSHCTEIVFVFYHRTCPALVQLNSSDSLWHRDRETHDRL
jgi:hypothetical protein